MIAASASIHPAALVEPGAVVGERTRIWAWAHVLGGAVIGDDCNICDHTFVEGGVRLGSRVTVKCGVYLWEGVEAEDEVFIGPAVAFTNDLRPRSRQYPSDYARTRLGRGASIGANATLLPVNVGRYAMIGAASLVSRDVPDYALVRGNPSRWVAWVCRCGLKLSLKDDWAVCSVCGTRYAFKDGTLSELSST